MTSRKVLSALVAIFLALLIAACGRPSAGAGWIRLPGYPSSALAIVAGDLAVDRQQVTSVIAQSARPNEHLELIEADSSAGDPTIAGVSPAAPTTPGPAAPKRLSPDPTQYQIDAHKTQEAAYNETRADDVRLLRAKLASSIRTWSEGLDARLAEVSRPDPTRLDVPAGLATAVGYFSSLQQAGVALGTRRVAVVLWPRSGSASAIPLAPDSLVGVTVVLANFPGDQRAQAEWQADLLQAGASRAIVLTAGAMTQLGSVTSNGLSGHASLALTVVRFALGRASLDAATRHALIGLADELNSTYRNSPANVLGFADPLGAYSANLRLSFARATAVQDFLVGHKVSASRLFAVGYGPALPVSPSVPNGAQPLDRRVVVVIEVAS
jgi:outer membrane protein OmpA-like peptidoglycan-associated protein